MLIKKIFIIILLFVCAGCSGKHFEPFSGPDTARQVVYTTVTIVDWRQTQKLRDAGYDDNSPALGPYPSRNQVDTKISLGIVAHGLVTWYLDPEFRPYWQYSWIGIELNAVDHNIKLGFKVDF